MGCGFALHFARSHVVPNDALRVNTDGTWTLIANLSAFQMANPVQNPEADDFESDGTWYGMVAFR
jgi:hypothetical protein